MANVSSSNGLEKRPKLRFPGFDEPWKEIKIGDIFKVTRGNVLSSALVSSEKSNGYTYPVFSSQTKDDGLMGYYNEFLFEDAITWTTDGANAGTVHFRKGKFYCTNVCGVLLNSYGYANRCIAEILGRVSKRYVSYVGNPKLMNNVMSEICIYIPSLAEQSHIDDFLLVLDKKIEKQRQLVDSLKKYKRGLNHKLIFEIDEQYNRELGTVCSIVGGGTPDTLRPEYWEGNVEWFTPSEIGNSKYVLSSIRKISRIGLSNSSAKLLPAGTVLLTTRATLGEMSIARSECSTNQGFQSLVADSKRVLPEYLYYLQILIKPWCEKYASGNTFREISKASLSKCVVPIPDLNSQKSIVCMLSLTDDFIETQEKVEDSLKQIKEGLLQQLFICLLYTSPSPRDTR